MKKLLLSAPLLVSLYAWAEEDFVLYQVERGDSLSEILYDKFKLGQTGRPRIYGPKGALLEVAKLNEMKQKDIDHLLKGRVIKVPKKFHLPEVQVHVPATEAPREEAAIEEKSTYASESWTMLQFGTYLYNRSEYSGPTTLAAERYVQPVLGIEHYLDSEAWGLSAQGFIAQFFNSDPYVPLEYQANLALRVKKDVFGAFPLLQLRYDHSYYFAGTNSDPKAVKHDASYGGVGAYFTPSWFERSNRLDVFYLRSLSSKSEFQGNDFEPRGNSYNVNWLLSLNERWGLESQIQLYDLEDKNHDISQLRLFTLLGYKF